MKAIPTLRFENINREFTTVLNTRVKDYFKTNHINRFANTEMVIKTVVMLLLYFGPYALLLTGIITGTLFSILLIIIMGIGLAGIGLSVMHDANHGAYSKKKWINNTIGYTMNLIGSNAFNWKVQHNILHHSYTNIHEVDEDITGKVALRISPHDTWKWYHRYQHIYAWFLYGLMTLGWILYSDFKQLTRYQKDGWIKKQQTTPNREWTILIISKMIYWTYILIIPLLFAPWAWWQVLLGFTIMQYVTGFILAVVFQPAHVTESTEFPQPDENQILKDNWAIHQLRTTINFANNSRWFTWYVGGLNYQIEHHLFPNICHVHYRKIADIVKHTAAEYSLPYHQMPTFGQALQAHQRILKELGKGGDI